MLLTKFVPNSTIRRCSFGTNYVDYDDKFTATANSNKVPIKYKNKGVDTKMHKCLVGAIAFLLYTILFSL